jgi:tRNA dimethylallyltransferase
MDPTAASRIHPNDPQRIQRALEVIAISGQPISELQQEKTGSALKYHVHKVIISPEPRSILHARIEQRFDLMLQAGFIEEMKSLYSRPDLTADMPAMRAVGYRQAWQWLAGECSFEEMREKAIAATRQLAKRQLTWLRREGVPVWYDLRAEGSTQKVFAEIGGFLEA